MIKMPKIITQAEYDQMISTRKMVAEKHRLEYFTWKKDQAIKAGAFFSYIILFIGGL